MFLKGAFNKLPHLNLSFFSPKIVDGVAIAPLEVLEDGKQEWQEYLIGYFLDRKLPFSLIRDSLEKQWILKGSFDMVADKDHFFSSSLVRMTRNRFLKLVLLSLHAEFLLFNNLNKKKVQTIPIWINVYKVPKIFWSKQGLSFIASLVGKPSEYG
ncbi:hypothetical protein FRX31_005098 [Thalictrum thalictroides]|uniref:DUF4283 domain-containing protein n=1 Tax=Thalictrum thalictroides TaxID=46969 RepID=A0A7J6X8X8_THATH|nr:hypothetical protein FRX31_005098 [Thalictrum thalictroides]